MSDRGGKRTGAGRPKGSTTKRTRDIVAKHVAKKGAMMPLDVMLTAMQRHADADRWDEAAKIAANAAPYAHPRLAAVEHGGAGGGPIEIVGKLQRDAAVSAALRADS